jgi:hypothetical protein
MFSPDTVEQTFAINVATIKALQDAFVVGR